MRCDGRSKSAYVFEDGMALSEAAEDWLAGHLDGEHCGVTVTYYFSLKDLLPLEKLLPQMAER